MKKTINTRKGTLKEDPKDVIQLILRDHRPLKSLIQILKDSNVSYVEKQNAFAEFAPLLLKHAKPEEQSVYIAIKQNEDTRADAFEGDTEHAVAEQLIGDLQHTHDRDEWLGKVKVLAEMVEHHIEEEEQILLPRYKMNSTLAERIEIGEIYLYLREEFGRERTKHFVRDIRMHRVPRYQYELHA